MQKVAVIGLGRFGSALAEHLTNAGAQVLAIDSSASLVNEVMDRVDVAVRLDSTDEAALASQDLKNFDVCVIAIGENFEAGLLTTVIAKKLGVPHIICRAQSAFHAEIFRQIGAHEVVQPETQTGQHLARRLANPHLQDFISLADGYTLIELKAPAAFQGKTLQALGLRTKYNVNLVVIKHLIPAEEGVEGSEPTETVTVPGADDLIGPNDILVLVGADEALARLPRE